MRVLIGNMVKTDVADYPCATREEAEALFMALREPNPSGHDESRRLERERANTGPEKPRVRK
jgi:hypothetical protein